MKETKVYVDELPESCIGCKYFAEHRRQCNLELCLQWNEVKFKFDDCPLIDIKTHDREKDKRIKELEQKVQELQEVDNKKSFKLYCVLYDLLEEEDPENVASRIEYMTSENYADICEMYKTAKNIKQHDKELVAKVLGMVRENLKEELLLTKNENQEEAKLKLVKTYSIDLDVLNKIEKEILNGYTEI